MSNYAHALKALARVILTAALFVSLYYLIAPWLAYRACAMCPRTGVTYTFDVLLSLLRFYHPSVLLDPSSNRLKSCLF
jgi:hypothetical protein